MKSDIILCGVGGQGVLSIAAIIAKAAAAEGLTVRQSEVHGMAQRGGAVLSHLRIADGPIHSDLVPKGSGDIVISMEPLESLRYLDWLSPDAAVVTASEPIVNIPDYPELDSVLAKIKALPKAVVVDASALAKEAGLPKAVNMVMTGAASGFLPIRAETFTKVIAESFAAKGDKIVEANQKAFNLGR
jgi:indolepyruvate ferredoxin oxidoreductase beta subunit